MKKIWHPLSLWEQVIHSRGLVQPTSKAAGDRSPQVNGVNVAYRDRPGSLRVAQTAAKVGRVSVILPVYNEQACIHQTFDAVVGYLYTHANYQFIFVNDGSTDRTKQILENRIKAAQTQQIYLLSYQPQGGKGFAIRQGVAYAEGDYICYLDSDLAYSLDHLDLLVEQLQNCEVAIGSRNLAASHIKGLKFSRKVAGKVFNLLSRSLLNLRYRDMQAGIKGFQKSAAKAIFKQQSLTGFSFDVELLYVAEKRGYAIAEVPAIVSDHHQQKLSKVNLLQDSIKMLIDLLKVRWNDVMGRYQ
jgi:dolichyl-phosphate beta-glucosyltransferase